MKTRKKAMLLAVSVILIVIATTFSSLAYLTSEATVTHTFTVGDVKAAVITASNTALYVGDGNLVKDGEILKLVPYHDYYVPVDIQLDPQSEEAWVFVQVINPLEPIEAESGSPMSDLFSGILDGDEYMTVDEQLKANNWVPLSDALGAEYGELDGVYYYDETPDDVNTGHAVSGGYTLGLYNCFKVTSQAVKGTVEENNANIIAEAVEYAEFRDEKLTKEDIEAIPLLTEEEELLCLGEYDGKQITVIVYIVQADGIPSVDTAWEIFADKYERNLAIYSAPENVDADSAAEESELTA